MALADQTVTISGTTTPLPRTGQSFNAGQFLAADGNIQMDVSHRSTGTRKQSLIKLTHRKVAADPLLSGKNDNVSASVHIVINRPLVGYSQAELKAIYDGFVAQLNATSGVVVTKVLGGES